MNIEGLRAFYLTVYYGNISMAAKHLFLSQPAVSQQIKALERDLGESLLKRSNKGVEPTEVGKRVYEYAESLLALYDNMLSDVKSCREGVIRRLSISCCPTLGEYALPCTLVDFKERYRDVEIHIEHNVTSQVIADVKEKGVDIGFIEGSYCADPIQCRPLGTSELFFVYNPAVLHSCPQKKEDLYRYPMFIINRHNYLRELIDKTLANHCVDLHRLRIELESPSLESIKSSVISGQGIAILPYIAIKKELYTKTLATFPLEDIKFPYTYSMIFNMHNSKSVQQDFVQFIKKTGKNTFC